MSKEIWRLEGRTGGLEDVTVITFHSTGKMAASHTGGHHALPPRGFG